MTEPTQSAHAPWSASATSRNWACSGALALGEQVGKLDIESEAAAWGTACHSVAEKCLKSGKDAEEFIGTVETTKRFSFEVDTELAQTAQTYVDYVRGLGGDVQIEQRFTLADINPPFEAGGTADAVVYQPAETLLEVIDLKGGRGMKVEVTENKQLRTYALGALLANPGLKVTRLKSTIVQPRMQHKDGVVRSEEFHVADLLEWSNELTARMDVAAEAKKALADVKGDLMKEAWGDKFLVAGDHCTFCPAAGVCPALQKKALAVADAFFNDNGQIQVRNQPGDLDPARIAAALDGADILTGWLNAVRALATRLAQTGTDIPGYQLSERIGNRRFQGEFPAEGLKKLGITDDEIYTLAMRSPAQLEKKMGAKRLREIGGKAKLDALIHRPVTGVSLVSSSKTTRPAVASAAEKFFA